jgi:hypothetical protein
VTAPKVGPITIDEFRQVWLAAVDTGYSNPLIQAGEGNGIEAYSQAWAQFCRVSKAIDVTTQAMFILPWSGQSNPPSALGQQATASLTVARSLLPQLPLVLSAGTFVEEQITDWGDPEGVLALTGRRYTTDADLVIEPGTLGPLSVGITAERIGYGYNNPQPGTISVVDQPGTQFTNEEASVRLVNYPATTIARTPASQVFLDAANMADAFVPQHVGQYLEFTAGANAGTIARIVAWQPPNLAAVPPTGGTVQLELTQGFLSFVGHFTGTFQAGETLELKNGASVSGYGVLQDASPAAGGGQYVLFTKTNGSAVTSIVGDVSGATATIDVSTIDLDYAAETGTAAWRILDWVVDFGLTASNPEQPTGGLAAMLNALGEERGLPQAPGETEAAYRQRVAAIADVVTPNAVKRAIQRTIPGVLWYFREAGQASYPGFFLDQDFLDYDMVQIGVSGSPFVGMIAGEPVRQLDPTTGWVATGNCCMQTTAASSVPGPPGVSEFVGVNNVGSAPFVVGYPIVGQFSHQSVLVGSVAGGISAANLFRVIFDYFSMRGWFYVGIAPSDAGDSGFAYDTGPLGGYDLVGPLLDFYDGYPIGEATRNLTVWSAVNAVRAGGVGFTIYPILPPEAPPPS